MRREQPTAAGALSWGDVAPLAPARHCNPQQAEADDQTQKQPPKGIEASAESKPPREGRAEHHQADYPPQEGWLHLEGWADVEGLGTLRSNQSSRRSIASGTRRSWCPAPS
ncbi:MAG TPA: hypothetical protein VHJ82_09935, partial [Actinomycetota bacterium]|nr:hypothetical protein [Actinomycetota bacterium]